jgi:hypothetical protein
MNVRGNEKGAEVLDLVEAHLSRFVSYPSLGVKIAHVFVPMGFLSAAGVPRMY